MHLRQSGEDLSRLLALSDGLFAIVLTLLVLDLRLPEPSASASGDVQLRAFVELWPRLFSFVLTFLVAGSYWLAHHADFAHIARYDRTLLWLNLMFLLSVSLLPFTTGLVGNYSYGLPWAVYALLMVLIGLTLTAIWGYALSAGLVEVGLDPALRRHIMLRHLVTPCVFLLSLLLAPLPSPIPPLVLVLIPVGYRVVEWRLGVRPALPSAPAPGWGRRGWVTLGYVPLLVFVGWWLWSTFIYGR